MTFVLSEILWVKILAVDQRGWRWRWNWCHFTWHRRLEKWIRSK